jgi:predicted O-methyltransferase YrrM
VTLRDFARFWTPTGLMDIRRARRRRQAQAEEVPAVSFDLPVVDVEDLFPGSTTDEVFLSGAHAGITHEWEMPLRELVILGLICRYLRARRVFEVGTFTGSTTLLFAMNTPGDAEIHTLDLEPNHRTTHVHGLGTGLPAFRLGAKFTGTHYADKIIQHFGDSQAFDPGDLGGQFDLVLIDADHTYEFVKHDTRMAFSLVRPEGAVVWDDYRWTPNHRECAGVTRVVHETATARPCFALAGTRLAISWPGRTAHGQ